MLDLTSEYVATNNHNALNNKKFEIINNNDISDIVNTLILHETQRSNDNNINNQNVID